MDKGDSEQFSLCWNNFHSNLSSGFHELLQGEDLVDVTLVTTGGRLVKAHRNVLSVCSPFFRDLFRSNPAHHHPYVILPPEVTHGALCGLLQFMYRGEVSVGQEEIPQFMRVAEMLRIKGLTDDNNGHSHTYTNQGGATSSTRPLRTSTGVKKNTLKPTYQQLNISTIPSSHASSKNKSSVSKETPSQPTQSNDRSRRSSESDSFHGILNLAPPLKKPKQEPMDRHEDEGNGDNHVDEDQMAHGEDEMNSMNNLDLAAMLDTKLSDADRDGNDLNLFTSSGSLTPAIPTTTTPAMSPSQLFPQTFSSTQSSGLVLMKSGRGQLVLIYNGHIYTLYDRTRDDRHVWACVKKRTLKCDGRLTTCSGPVLLSYSGHNHPQLQDVIERLLVSSRTGSTTNDRFNKSSVGASPSNNT